MTDALIKDTVSKNVVADGTRDGGHEAMSNFAANLYKKHESLDESKSNLSKDLDAKFKFDNKNAGTAGDTKGMPNDAAPSSPSVEKCLPNLKLFDSKDHSFDASPNASELKKNPPLDSMKDSRSKELQKLTPQDTEVPLMKRQ